MARVCQKDFPITDGFYMDGYLKDNMDILVDSIVNDFDFVILVSGNGGVRMGKSVLGGMQIGYYLNSQVKEKHGIDNPFTLDNFVFRGEELIKVAKTLPPYSVIVYDEAGSDLVGRKTMHTTTQALLDFFREVGQLNLFLICILPDFFDLAKSIALTRSICLIDVDFRERFNRGKFSFYSKKSKKYLYLKGKRWLDYDAQSADFEGIFVDFYTLDEKRYRELKRMALEGRERDAANKVSDKQKRLSNHRTELIRWLNEKGESQENIAEKLGVSQAEISRIINGELK